MAEINQGAREYELPGSNTTGIVLVHGFTASAAITKKLGKDLNEVGYHVFAPLLPGHGRCESDLRNGNVDNWLGCVSASIKRVRESGKEKVVCIGHSLGGIMSLIAAENGLCDGVISVAAPIKLYGGAKSRIFSVFFKNRFHEMRKPKETDTFRYYRADGRSVGHLLKAMKTAENGLRKISVPVFIVYSRDDKTVKPQSARIIYDGISSERKEIIEMGGSHHECIIGGRKEYFEKAVDFIESI